MKITVHLFGPQARMVGQSAVEFDGSDAPIACATLREWLMRAVPELIESLPTSRFAVNYEYVVDERQSIGPEDEVALIGMVSGG
jgi:molybdopterin converting factor small subunit